MKSCGIGADETSVLIRAADYIRSGDWTQAESILRGVLRDNPQNPDALHLLGLVAHHLGSYPTAASLIEKALALNPGESRMYSNCAETYRRMGDLERALLRVQRALELNLENPDAWCNHGSICRELGKFEDSILSYRRALSIQPDHANAHYNLGLALLVMGNFREGWKEYEYRWKALPQKRLREYRQPRWNGQPLSGKTIFVYPEQGQGDIIQFARFLPLLSQMGANVLFECPSGLLRLFQSFRDIDCRSSEAEIESFDYHISLLSLPSILATTLETIPASVPYLRAPEESRMLWKERLLGDKASCRIGICWAGNPQHVNDRNRSCRLSLFNPLSAIDGAAFYSLQKGDPSVQSKHSPVGMKFIDRTNELKDWGDTAALIESLDLVVTVDTAVAHLAGALGKRVWMLVPFNPDWRWLLGRKDSPWYPTMTLFRQPKRRDWPAVSRALFAAVSEAREKRDPAFGSSR